MILPRGQDLKFYQPGWSLADHEQEVILQALQAHNCKTGKTAAALKIGRMTLWRRMLQYGWMRRRPGFRPKAAV